MSSDKLSLTRIPGLSKSHRIYLTGEKGIMDIPMLIAIAKDQIYGRPGLMKGLGMAENEFDVMLEQAINILRKEAWACYLKMDKEWESFHSSPGVLPPKKNTQEADEAFTPMLER